MGCTNCIDNADCMDTWIQKKVEELFGGGVGIENLKTQKKKKLKCFVLAPIENFKNCSIAYIRLCVMCACADSLSHAHIL